MHFSAENRSKSATNRSEKFPFHDVCSQHVFLLSGALRALFASQSQPSELLELLLCSEHRVSNFDRSTLHSENKIEISPL